jgi:SAM-dependent methyltransferase
VDLSKKSINRAKTRLNLSASMFSKKNKLIHDDVDHFLDQTNLSFDHIESYGVLHHLATPSQTILKMAQHLRPNGTMRIMVYNSHARSWIHQIQMIFKELGLSPYSKQDLKSAREFLNIISLYFPGLAKRLSYMGASLLQNNSRFADTFFHEHEAVISLEQWFQFFEQAKLTPYALFDRYGELDDLENPLWEMPSLSQLSERIADGRFENNIELWLRHNDDGINKTRDMSCSAEKTSRIAELPHPLQGRYPNLWSSFSETSSSQRKHLKRLWHIHRTAISRKKYFQTEELSILNEFKTLQQKRLARIGAILPSMTRTQTEYLKLKEPIHTSMENVSYETLPKEVTTKTLMQIFCHLPLAKIKDEGSIQFIFNRLTEI